MKKTGIRRWVAPALGYAAAAGGLAWVLHDVRASHLRDSMAAISWPWIGLAVLCDVLSYYAQGLRWELLLRPLGRISSWQTTQAIYVGLLVNETLPMRLGELVRGYLVTRRLATGFVAVVPSMVVERLLDAVWIAAGIGLTAMFVPLPRDLLRIGDLLGVVVLAGTALFFYLVYRARGTAQAPPGASAWPLVGWLRAVLARLANGFRSIGVSRGLYLSFCCSLLIIVFQGLSFWLVMMGCGLRLSPWIGMAVLLIVHVGTAIPNAPANVGSYQFFCVVGLTLFGVDKTLATGFSLVVFVVLTVPLWLLGLLALSRTGMSLAQIRLEIERLRRQGIG